MLGKIPTGYKVKRSKLREIKSLGVGMYTENSIERWHFIGEYAKGKRDPRARLEEETKEKLF